MKENNFPLSDRTYPHIWDLVISLHSIVILPRSTQRATTRRKRSARSSMRSPTPTNKNPCCLRTSVLPLAGLIGGSAVVCSVSAFSKHQPLHEGGAETNPLPPRPPKQTPHATLMLLIYTTKTATMAKPKLCTDRPPLTFDIVRLFNSCEDEPSLEMCLI